MSMENKLKKLLQERILIGDGAIGTLLQQRGLKAGMAPESMLLNAPEEVEAVHRLYVEAGADMVTTNSFGGSRPKLAQHGLENQLVEINRRAVDVARKVAGDRVFVAASIGPTGELLKPMGSMSMDQLVEIYIEQVRPLLQAGADFAILETMGDIGELQAAARACFLEGLSFMASMTFDMTGRSLAGSTAEIAAITIEPYQPLAIGTNCGMGPRDMVNRVLEYAAATAVPVLAQSNAGLPELVGNKTVFRLTPEKFAERSVKLVEAGAAIVGGCCGTTPDHIKALKKAVNGLKPQVRKATTDVRFASRSGIAIAGNNNSFCMIGERINPTGRKILSKLLKKEDFSRVRKDAQLQVARGANILDINMGVPDTNEPELMVKAINSIQGLLPEIPLSIDSNDPETLVAGMHEVIGRPLMNSINGEESRIHRLMPIVHETGANFIALAMDEKGIPEDAEARMKIIRRIINHAESLGITRDRILVDCLVFTVGSQPHQPRETLETVKRVRQELGCGTILGVSNVSFGLPRRAVISSTFLAMSLQAGLTAGIINPLSDRMAETLAASELLLNRDAGARKFVRSMEAIQLRQDEKKKTIAEKPVKDVKRVKQSSLKSEGSPVRNAVLEGDKEGVIVNIDELLNHQAPGKILADELVPAIEEVGRKYGAGEIYLPQLIMAGEAMRAGVNRIRPLLKEDKAAALHGTPVIIGTVNGDVHDIGKNIVSIVLENHGFKVIDLGKNVDMETFVEAVKKHEAPVVALSALMTTTMPAMEETVNTLHDECSGVKVMVGGAVVTRAFADRIHADGYAKEAIEAGSLAKMLAEIP